MGSLTSQENSSPPHTSASTLSSIKIALFRRESPILRYPLPKTQQILNKYWGKRETFSYVTSVREGRTVFTTCVSWTMMPYLTGTSHRGSVFRRQRRIIIRSIWSPPSINVFTSPPLSSLWMESSAWRRRTHLNAHPAASLWNGIRPTCRCAAKLRIGWPSPWSVPPTTASRYPGYRHTRSPYSDISGIMGPDYTSPSKEIMENQNIIEKFILFHLKRKSKKSGDQNCYFWEKIVGGVSPQLWLTQLPFTQHARTFHQQYKKSSLELSCTTYKIISITIWYYY